MIGLIQRVCEASVQVESQTIAAIGAGVLALIGVERIDTAAAADRLARRILAYRIFPDAAGRMNLSLREHGGGLLLVPQFTLVADTRRGNRASFSTAADPREAAALFDVLLGCSRALHPQTQAGRFAAYMKVHSVNDGPVTFWLSTR